MALVSTIIKEVVKYASRYYRLEGKAFNKLYTGFPQSKTIGRGVRHGLTGGSIVGSLINTAEDTPGNGFQTPFFKQPKTGSQNKARNRPTKRYYSRNTIRCKPDYKRGRSFTR